MCLINIFPFLIAELRWLSLCVIQRRTVSIHLRDCINISRTLTGEALQHLHRKEMKNIKHEEFEI